MKKQNIRDTPVIVIPKGYTIDDLMDFATPPADETGKKFGRRPKKNR